MHDSIATIFDHLSRVRRTAPLIHNITNLVVMQITANALLAVGASPIMAHAEEELDEITGAAAALVLNIGTLTPTLLTAMKRAREIAVAEDIPVVIDPVGAGASALRVRAARELLEAAPGALVRGNPSEIMALAGVAGAQKGVDSAAPAGDAADAALMLARHYRAVVCVSGPEDMLTNGTDVVRVSGGSPYMSRVTGMGCSASALMGAFAAVAVDDPLGGAVSAMAVMAAAGTLADARSRGPGSFLVEFLDTLANLDQDALRLGAEVCGDACLARE